MHFLAEREGGEGIDQQIGQTSSTKSKLFISG